METEGYSFSDAPIAIFDSGVGGITVLRELIKLMPNENYIYLGDEKNAPYGALTHQRIREIMLKNANELISLGAKAMVIACNTATAAAIDILRATYQNTPIIGIEPAVKPAVTAGYKKIIVLATPLTVSERRFSSLITNVESHCEQLPEIKAVPCPGLSSIIEDGDISGDRIDSYLYDIFASIDGFDAIVLGCTHYPLAYSAIKKAAEKINPSVCIFDGAGGTARQTEHRLCDLGLRSSSKAKGSVSFISTGNTEALKSFYERTASADRQDTERSEIL